MYNPSSASPSSSSAGGIQDIFNSWVNVLTKPSIQTMQMELPKASQNNTMMSVGIAVAVSAVLGALGGAVFGGVGGVVGGLILGVLQPLISFALAVAGLYIGAVVVNKGSGTIQQQAWIQSTYWAPITILGALPVVGIFLGWIGSLYSIYLTYLAAQAVHRLDSSKAIVATLIYLAVGIVVGFIIAGIVVTIIAGIFVATAAVTPS